MAAASKKGKEKYFIATQASSASFTLLTLTFVYSKVILITSLLHLLMVG